MDEEPQILLPGLIARLAAIARPAGRFLRIAPVAPSAALPGDLPPPLAAQMAQVGTFLALHQLPVSSATLAAAFECVAGGNSWLTGQVDAQCLQGHPITEPWLAHVRRPDSAEAEGHAMSRLMERLESNIDAFTRTTVEARQVTGEYHSTLQAQVDELNHVSQAGAAIAEMVAAARSMIDRTSKIEQQIIRSEEETRALYLNLEEARRTAEHDHLTGLPNRRAFELRLGREVVAAQSGDEPLCVAFCDIDRFKRINDTHGHEAGDRILKVVAHALNEISDERCHVARHGGEEFVVLLRGRPLAEAWAILDEARAGLAERRMVNRGTDIPFGKVTFSAGIADVFDHADPRAALKAADEALYAAKHEGRNRVLIAPAPGMLVQAEPRAA